VTVQQLQSVYKAIYVDTEGTFRSERIVQIAKAKALDPTKVLQNVKLVTTLNSARLESILQEECPIQIEKDKNIKLLIIDSIINHYRAEYSGRSMLSQKQHRLSRIMHLLQNIAQAYDIAIVITNQVQTSADAYTPPANADKPMGEILWLIQVHLEFR
jgi:DNA repair protein RadA